jgi:cytochrome c
MSKRVTAVLACLAVLGAACGGGDGGSGEPSGAATPAAGELSAEQIEKGIGPVTDLRLDEVDQHLAGTGEEIFTTKCSACHQLDDRYVGPPLRDVTVRRTPEYVMNMMLNPAEMLQRHPAARQLLAEYYTPMPSQDLTMDEARALLEYLREAAEHSGQLSLQERGS